jgi:Ca2+-binding RTX toxin-like protein
MTIQTSNYQLNTGAYAHQALSLQGDDAVAAQNLLEKAQARSINEAIKQSLSVQLFQLIVQPPINRQQAVQDLWTGAAHVLTARLGELLMSDTSANAAWLQLGPDKTQALIAQWLNVDQHTTEVMSALRADAALITAVQTAQPTVALMDALNTQAQWPTLSNPTSFSGALSELPGGSTRSLALNLVPDALQTSSNVAKAQLTITPISTTTTSSTATSSATALAAPDSAPPSIVLGSDKVTLLKGQTAQLSFTLSEDSLDFGLDDITANDTLDGSKGDDTVIGGSGNDYLNGGTGIDWADYTPNLGDPTTGVTVNLMAGTAIGAAGSDTLVNVENVLGGPGNDSLVGNVVANWLMGAAGNDTLFGDAGAGNDTVYLGSAFHATQQADLGDGNDMVFALDSSDSLVAGAGHDTVSAGHGNNTITGGAGNDSILSGRGTDRIDAGADNDWVSAGDGANTVVGGAGNDTIITGTGNDYIDAGVDNDWINAAGGVNSVNAGDGNDYILVNSASSSSTLLGGLGNDTISSSGSNNTLMGGDGDDRITQIGLYAGSIHGGAGNDNIVSNGSTGAETVWGGYGDDFIDLRNGGTTSGDRVWGDDTINELIAGNDTIYTSDAASAVNAGAGSDWVLAGLGSDAIALGTGNDTAFGMGGNDTMDGGAGADWMDAGVGNDSMHGGSTDNGQDTLLGGTGNDNISGGAGSDWMDGGVGDDTIIGGEGITGSVLGNDTIIIGAGANIARGELGSDVFVYDNNWMNDSNADTIDGGAGVDILKFDGSELALDLTQTGTNNWVSIERIDLTGSGNNTLRLAREDIVELSDLTDVANANLNLRARLMIDGNTGDAVDVSVFNATTTKLTSGSLSIDLNGNGVLDANETTTVNANGLITMDSLMNGPQTYTVYNVSNTVAGTTTNYGLLIIDTDVLLTGV